MGTKKMAPEPGYLKPGLDRLATGRAQATAAFQATTSEPEMLTNQFV